MAILPIFVCAFFARHWLIIHSNPAGYEKILFQADERFEGPSSRDLDKAWSATLPGLVGLMYVNDSKKYDLPDGRLDKDGVPQVYGLSWTHQYHCLVCMHLRPPPSQPTVLLMTPPSEYAYGIGFSHCYVLLQAYPS